LNFSFLAAETGMQGPLVTIAIPTYNRADSYFRDALNSALAQTYPNLEIIVADNGSTDNTGEVVKSYRDPRIQYVRHDPPKTMNENFNFCLHRAAGDYIIILHDDDVLDPDFIESCVNAVPSGGSTGIIRTGTRLIDAHGGVLRQLRNEMGGLSTAEFMQAWLDSKTWMFMCCSLFNTAALRAIGGLGSKHNLFQDVLGEFEVAAKYGHADVAEVKTNFRKHGSQATSARKVEQWCEDSEFLLQRMCEMAPEQRESILAKGKEHFAKHNYDLAQSVAQRRDRYRIYWQIYRTFGYSPLTFFAKRWRHRLFTWLGRVKRSVLGVSSPT
jgi:glycosyltransferase involved in cell wall biosynthesis